MLNREKLVMSPARHYLISSTIELTLAILDVNGADIEAYVWESDNPASDCLSAPQSFAPSPHIDTTFPSPCWYDMTILALSLGFALA